MLKLHNIINVLTGVFHQFNASLIKQSFFEWQCLLCNSAHLVPKFLSQLFLGLFLPFQSNEVLVNMWTQKNWLFCIFSDLAASKVKPSLNMRISGAQNICYFTAIRLNRRECDPEAAIWTPVEKIWSNHILIPCVYVYIRAQSQQRTTTDKSEFKVGFYKI